MTDLFITLATEDILSEEVGLRLISEIGSSVQPGLILRKGGNGYLRSRISNFCEISQREIVLLLTDLDTGMCQTALIESWIPNIYNSDRLIFRVVVHEIESWILADHEAMQDLFRIRPSALPDNPDTLRDPKRSLLELAKNAPRDVKADLLPSRGAIASRGLGYNNRLVDVVQNRWNPERAALRSNSLRRTRIRLREAVESFLAELDMPVTAI